MSVSESSSSDEPTQLPYEHLVDRVEIDTSMEAVERETSLNIYGDAEEVRIHTYRKSLVKRLFQNAHFSMEAAFVSEGNSRERVSVNEVSETDGDIVGCAGTVPVGCLTIKSVPRSTDHHSTIVKTQKGLENARNNLD